MSAKGVIYGGTVMMLLAGLMSVHLAAIWHQSSQCERYEQVLIDRLGKVPVGSLRARELREEIAGVLSGKLQNCRKVEGAFDDASDKYLAVLLSLLTGAGLAVGGAAVVAQGRRRMEEDEEPPPRRPPDPHE